MARQVVRPKAICIPVLYRKTLHTFPRRFGKSPLRFTYPKFTSFLKDMGLRMSVGVSFGLRSKKHTGGFAPQVHRNPIMVFFFCSERAPVSCSPFRSKWVEPIHGTYVRATSLLFTQGTRCCTYPHTACGMPAIFIPFDPAWRRYGMPCWRSAVDPAFLNYPTRYSASERQARLFTLTDQFVHQWLLPPSNPANTHSHTHSLGSKQSSGTVVPAKCLG